MQEIISLISTLVNTAIVPLLGYFIFYNAKKRQEEAAAAAAETNNATAVAHEWQQLYEQRDRRVDELNTKIDQLYNDIARYRDELLMVREQHNALKLRFDTAEYNKCMIEGCKKRQPPRKEEGITQNA